MVKVQMKTLVLDGMEVIYSVGDDVAELLCPFVAERGGLRDADRVSALYQAASLGRLSSREFWRAVSVDPGLEEEYLALHRLNGGMLNLLQAAHVDGYPIWCLSNDVSEWSHKLRERFKLTELIRGFLISGDVGIRKPGRAIFEHMLERTGKTPSEIIFVDDNATNLDAAATLGIQTIWFTRKYQCGGNQHFAVRDCDERHDSRALRGWLTKRAGGKVAQGSSARRV